MALWLLFGLGPALETQGATSPDSRVTATPHFEFHSDFEINLNDALVAVGLDRVRGDSELFQQGPEMECLEEMPPSVRSAWNQAVDWYAEVVSETSWAGRQQWLLRLDLTGLRDVRDDPGKVRFLEIAAALRRAAAPAYRACRWPAQDAVNRSWIQSVAERLERYEAPIVARLAEMYQQEWHGLPIRVDLVPAALPVGASTFNEPPHVLISHEVAEHDALEIVLHEGSHTLLLNDGAVHTALARAASTLEVKKPRDLWHPLMFHLTGLAVAEALEAGDEPGYVAYAERHGIWSGRWAKYEAAVREFGDPYFAGRTDLDQMALALIRRISELPGADRE